MEFQIKRVYDDALPEDGYRILVDRLWPRGVTRERAALDLWGKDLAPSHELRKWFDHDPQRLAEFSKRYVEELEENSSQAKALILDADDAGDADKVTLLYAAKNPDCNHAAVLRDWLADNI